MTIPGFLRRNLALKGLAVGLALFSWVAVVYAGNPPDTRTVTVAVPPGPSLPKGFVLAQAIPRLSLRISGTRDHVNAFDVSSLGVTVDYSHIAHTGLQALPLTIVNNDHDVSLDGPPSTVEADIDREASVTLPVTLKRTADPPTGYLPGKVALSPDHVTVSGPSRQLEGIRVEVRVNLQNRKVPFNASVTAPNLVVLDGTGRTVTDLGLDPTSIEVSIDVVSQKAQRASAVVPHITGTVARGYEVVGASASPLAVTLSGSEDLLNGLDTVSTQAISISGLTGTVTFSVAVSPPAGVTADPTSVTVTVSVAPIPAATPSPTPTPTPSPSPSPTH